MVEEVKSNSAFLDILRKSVVVQMNHLNYKMGDVILQSPELTAEILEKAVVKFKCKSYEDYRLLYKKDNQFCYFLSYKTNTNKVNKGTIKI